MSQIIKQFCKFSAVGAAAFLADYGLLFLLTENLQMHYLSSSMLSFTAATVFNYVYSTKYVFSCESSRSKSGQFTLFLLLSGCGLIVNVLLMRILVEYLTLHYMGAKICAAVIVSVWNFVSRKMMLEEKFSFG